MTIDEMIALMLDHSKMVYGSRLVPNEEYESVVNPFECIADRLRELETQLAIANEALELAEYLKAQVTKHGAVWVKQYYSEYERMLSIMDRYCSAGAQGLGEK